MSKRNFLFTGIPQASDPSSPSLSADSFYIDSSTDRWQFNKSMNVDGVLTVNGELVGIGDIESLGIIRHGKEEVQTGIRVYTINHDTINPETDVPFVSLTIPASGEEIFVQGITDRTSGSFDVILSGTPSTSGYEINWNLNTSGNGYIVKEYGVQQTSSTTVTPNLFIKDVYEITLTDATNTTINTPVNMVEGQSLLIVIKQGGASGTGTVTFDSAYKFPGNLSFVASDGSDRGDLVSITKVGGILYASAAQEYFL